MPTTAAVLLEIAKKLRGVRFGTATGGNNTTLIDTALVEPNDWFNGGTIWFLSAKTTPSGTEPTGMSAGVTDWASSTYTFTFPALSGTPGATVGAGVRYAVIDANYTRDMLVQALNMALVELGPFDAENTSLATVADQVEYDLPAGVSDLLRVEIATSTTAPYNWYTHYYWREAPGSHLRFDEQYLPDAGYTIRLTYGAQHTAVLADADTVTSDAHIDLIAWCAAKWASMNRSGLAENAEPNTKERLQYATQMTMQMKMAHPIRKTMKTPRRAGWTAPEVY